MNGDNVVTHLYILKGNKLDSHKLQQHCLAHYLNVPISTIKINRDQKPTCTSHAVEFSVSHTKNIFTIIIGTKPMGIDIEVLNRKIPLKVLNRNRQLPINRYNKNHWEEKHITEDQARVIIWTCFEATVKLTGRGLHFPIPEQFAETLLSFVWQDLRARHSSHGVYFFLYHNTVR